MTQTPTPAAPSSAGERERAMLIPLAEVLRDSQNELRNALDCLRMVINATSSDRLYKEANVAAKDCVAAIERIDKALSPMTELCSEPLESPDYSRPGGPKTEAERERMIREAAMEANKTRKADLQRVGVTTENILAPVAAAYEACAKIAEAEAERISGDYRAGAGALCVATAIRKAAQGLEHPIPSPAPSPAHGGEDIVERRERERLTELVRGRVEHFRKVCEQYDFGSPYWLARFHEAGTICAHMEENKFVSPPVEATDLLTRATAAEQRE